MTTRPSPTGGLAVITVPDLSLVPAGPWCTQVLAGLGADAAEVEHAGLGDDTTQTRHFTACNRNKRSVAIDMTTAPIARRSSGRWPCRPASWWRTTRSTASGHTAQTTGASWRAPPVTYPKEIKHDSSQRPRSRHPGLPRHRRPSPDQLPHQAHPP